jgi:hypothetical protein
MSRCLSPCLGSGGSQGSEEAPFLLTLQLHWLSPARDAAACASPPAPRQWVGVVLVAAPAPMGHGDPTRTGCGGLGVGVLRKFPGQTRRPVSPSRTPCW